MTGRPELEAAMELTAWELDDGGIKGWLERENIDFGALSDLARREAVRCEGSSRPALMSWVSGFLVGLAVSRQRELLTVPKEGSNG